MIFIIITALIICITFCQTVREYVCACELRSYKAYVNYKIVQAIILLRKLTLSTCPEALVKGVQSKELRCKRFNLKFFVSMRFVVVCSLTGKYI